jgi:hypothetical protein
VVSLLDSIFNENAKGMKPRGMMKEKDFKDQQVKEVETFINSSANFNKLMDLNGKVTTCNFNFNLTLISLGWII